MKALIISDYDCGCNWSVKDLDDNNLKAEFKGRSVFDLFNSLEVIIEKSDDIEYYKKEYYAEFCKAYELLESYDKVILCRDGNILIYDKNV